MTRMRHITQELESADSLLAAITSEEERQEARVQQELQGGQEEYQNTARRFTEEEAHKEEMFLSGTREELRTYAETEPKAVLEKADAQAKTDVATAKGNAKKNAKKVASDLLNQLLTLSFLSRS